MMTGNGIAIAHGWQQTGTPPVPLCFRYATISATSGTSFTFSGWTINGLDFTLNYVAEFAAQGCTSNNPYTNQSAGFSSHDIIIWYMGDGTSDPSFTILNNSSAPVPLTWNSICQKTCYECIIPSIDPTIVLFDIMGPDFLGLNVNLFDTLGSFGDLSSPASIAAMQAYYQECCGVDTTISVTTDDNGDYVVQILNAYVSYAPQWTNFSGTYFFIEIPC
jgi:hypothetical protein